jgi:hypothetical protein
MYTRSVRRMDLQILRSKALSRDGAVASIALVGIWIERSEVGFSGCDNLRSYVRDVPIISIGRRLSVAVILWLL